MSTLKSLIYAGTVALAFAATATNAQTVAVVDGTEITQAQLDAFAIMRTGQLPAEANREQLIEQLGDMIVLSNVALKNKLDRSASTQAEIELQRRSVLAQSAVNDFLSKNPVSDTQLREEYEKQIANMENEMQFKARHILLADEEAAKTVIKQLDDGGDFQALAKEKSTGPSGPQGGDLGWFGANAMVAPFSAAVAAMEDGKYSKMPVQTQFGWHVILREESRMAEPPSFEEVNERLRQGMEQQQFQEYFAALKADSKRELK
ncbi:MAG: peptidylprolyl isomerase [Pseudomonadota bacterium]